MFVRQALAVFSMVALSLSCAVPAMAQEFRGSVRGSVTDASGGVLPGVTVVVTNTETLVSQRAVNDQEARFQVLYLNPGSYSVSAELRLQEVSPANFGLINQDRNNPRDWQIGLRFTF